MDLPVSGVTTIKNFFRNDKITSIPYVERGETLLLKFPLDRKYRIPAYQRAISWSPANIQILLKDLSASKKYLGSILLSWNEDNVIDIIDGQQRITVILMILECLKEYNEGYEFEHCDFSNDTYEFFFEAIGKGFNFEGDEKREEYEIEDVLEQTIILKQLWDTICEYLELLGDEKRNELFKHLLDSYVSVLVSEVREGEDDSRRLCVDYFIDINNKSVQLDHVDILKAYAFRDSFETVTDKWKVVQKKTKELKKKGFTYSKELLFYHYFLCVINDVIPQPIKLGLTEDYKIREDIKKGEKIFKEGSDVELLITKPKFYIKMFNEIDSFLDFLIEVANDKLSPGDSFCSKFLTEGKKVDYDTISNIFVIIKNTMQNSDSVPKVLLLKYYLTVILNENKTENEIKSIYWINALAVWFSTYKTSSKSIKAFAPLVLKPDFIENVKLYAIDKLGTMPNSVSFAKDVMLEKVVTPSSGQLLSRRLNAVLEAYYDKGIVGNLNEKILLQSLNTQGTYNDEHFFVNESYKYMFEYNGEMLSFDIPARFKNKVSYLGNYMRIKSSINSELGNNMIKDKIRIIRKHLDAGDQDIFGNKFSELVFLTAEECFNNSSCALSEELKAEKTKELAIEKAERYYEEEFEEDFKKYLDRVRDIAYVVTAMRKKNANKVFVNREVDDWGLIKGELANDEAVFSFELDTGRWPIYRLDSKGLTKWRELSEKAIEGSICAEDLEGCDLEGLYNYILRSDEDGVEVKEFFSGLRDINDIQRLKCVYAIIDFRNTTNKPKFFLNKESVQKYFIDHYCTDKINWIEMDKKVFDSYEERVVEPFPVDTITIFNE